MKPRETAGVITYNDSRYWIMANNSVQSVNQPDSWDQSLLKCPTEPVMMWTMDLEISQHHAESIHHLVLVEILWSSFGYESIQGSDQFLKPRHSVILTNMESIFRPLSESGDNTNVWVVISRDSNPATWMCYDTRIQNTLQKALRKPICETCKKLIKKNQLCNRDLNAVHLMTTFLLTKGNGKTSRPVSTATNMSWNTISQNLLDNGYVMKIAVTEKLMEEFIGDWNVRNQERYTTRLSGKATKTPSIGSISPRHEKNE